MKKTYYPPRAAAEYAGVSCRTIYRWATHGYLVNGHKIRLKMVAVGYRLCIEELELKAFVLARSRLLEKRRKYHEKFTVE